jgi:hypothetical protein
MAIAFVCSKIAGICAPKSKSHLAAVAFYQPIRGKIGAFPKIMFILSG